MNVCLSGVLKPEQLSAIREKLGRIEFADGAGTAGWHARTVKQNQQAPLSDPLALELGNLIGAQLQQHPLFKAALLPHRMRTPMISRYVPGMSYGTHVDNALMGQAHEAIRTDVAVTVFLSEPADCEGGELVIESAGGEQAYKLAAGDAVTYPATSLHRVTPVTRGVRLAAVTWVQSYVRDAGQREILLDLDTVQRSVFQREGKTREFDLLAKSYANLLRAWADG